MDRGGLRLRLLKAQAEAGDIVWGLGIAGLFHQWERDIRFVISALAAQPQTG